MILDNLVFRLEHYKSDDWDLSDNCFLFYKIKDLVDQYANFWSSKPGFRANRIFELGIWDGGSIVFWFEFLKPKKHVGIDIQNKGDSKYFQHYKKTRGLEKRIKTYWHTNQAATKEIHDIVKNEFDGPLDLVLDDASHMYRETKKSFEILFPLLRPGGLYIIEDWAWEHWEEFHAPDHPWTLKTPLTRFICDLVKATGNRKDLISNLNIYRGFTVIERGGIDVVALKKFKINSWIMERPKIPLLTSAMYQTKRLLKRLATRLITKGS